MIALNEPTFDKTDIDIVKKCISSGWVSSAGKNIDKFEKKISDYTGSKYAIACINGTSAIHISILLSGAMPGSEIIVPSLTFIATINAIKYSNCEPIFMDSNNNFCLDVDKTIDFIKNHTKIKIKNKKKYCINKKTNKIISAIIPVHVFGNAVRLEKLITICNNYNIKIIEDAAESLGTTYTAGKYKNKHCGTIGTLGCLSFNGNKIITTGGGGIILTNSKTLSEKAKYLINQSKDDPINFIHNNIGYNYRLSNLHASLGLSQLNKINVILNKKKFVYNTYRKLLENKSHYSLMSSPNFCNTNKWLNILLIKNNSINLKDLIDKMLVNKISVRPIWYPNHLQVPYKKNQSFKITNTMKLLKTSICLPSSATLNIKEINKIIDLLP